MNLCNISTPSMSIFIDTKSSSKIWISGLHFIMSSRSSRRGSTNSNTNVCIIDNNNTFVSFFSTKQSVILSTFKPSFWVKFQIQELQYSNIQYCDFSNIRFWVNKNASRLASISRKKSTEGYSSFIFFKQWAAIDTSRFTKYIYQM